MLSIGSTSGAIASLSLGGGSKLGSSSCDHSHEDKLAAYLHRIAGYTDMEVNIVMKDHCYARPWNWKPENIYVKPTKNIFFSSSSRQERVNQLWNKLSNKDEIIDVENDDTAEELVLPYNLTKSRQNMEESQKLVNFIRPDDNSDDDWEETVEKTFWSPAQRRLFTRVYNIFRIERLSRLTNVNCAMELFRRRASMDSATKRFREILASTGWDWRIIQWLHSLLMSNLSREYLVIYLDILQTLRAKIPILVDRMITTVQSNNNTGIIQSGSIPIESLNALLKRSWDPISTCLNANRPKKLPGNPILIVISSGIATNLSSRQHKWITQLGTLGMVVTVHSHLGLSANRMTMMTCMEQLVQATRAKIQDVRNDCPGRPMILIGVNTGAALACQVAQMEHVTAVICLGFPFNTVEGKRGCPDDMLMDIRCPVMFVIGQNSNIVRPNDLEDVRAKMLVETCLVVVGTADDHLRISTAKIVSEGITQSMVDRCILDEIADFIGGILIQPHPLPLRSVGFLMNFDKSALKREPRKRKNSTCSSIDSESYSPNITKKTRSCTPIDQWHGSMNISNSLPVSRSLTTTSESTTQVTHFSNSTSKISHSIQRRNSRILNNQKINNSEQLQQVRQSIQQTTTLSKANGGLTLNIGSLASLAPLGPIRLTPSLSCPTANLISTRVINTSKSTSQTSASLSSITVTKTSKIIEANSNSQNLPVKLGNTVAVMNKTLLKTSGNSNCKKNINVDQSDEAKLVAVFSSGGNQARVASTTNSSTIQTKSIGTTTAPLTALLHCRKGPIVNNSAKTHSCTSTARLSTSVSEIPNSMCCCSTMTIGTTTMTTSTKVMENTSHTTPVHSPQSTTIKLKRNNRGSQSRKISSWLNKPMDIPKTIESSSMIIVDNNLQRNTSEKKLTVLSNLNDSFDNILDIPIIYAKNDDINAMKKTATSSLSYGNINEIYDQTNTEEQKSTSSLNTNIFNNQLILQNRSVSNISHDDSGSSQINIHRLSVNTPIKKNTKIILSKRNTNIANNLGNHVILTKKNYRVTPTYMFAADNLTHHVPTVETEVETLLNDMDHKY